MDPEINKIKSKSKNEVVGVGAGVGSGVGAGVRESVGVCMDAKNERKGKTNQKGKVVKTEKKESNEEESVSKNISEDKDDRTLEEHLKDFQANNDEFRRSLTSLTELVNNLQIRVGNLEGGHVDPQSRKLSNLSSHDEGVDLSEIAKDSFYQDGGESTLLTHSTVAVNLKNFHQ